MKTIDNFKYRLDSDIEETLNIGKIINDGDLTNSEINRLNRIRDCWNFYEGYHWEGIDDLGNSQVTFNYCRTFVNKFVAFELGKGMTLGIHPALEKVGVSINDYKVMVSKDLDDDGKLAEDEEDVVTQERKTTLDFLTDVWNGNKRDILLTEIGQTKGITGEAWVKVQYQSAEDLNDPFEEYPNGKIKLSVIPTQYVFPIYNDHDKDRMEQLLIIYPIRKVISNGILRRSQEITVLYKEVWTNDEIVVYEGKEEIDRMENLYGFIPYVQIKNFPIAGRSHGLGDLEDVIPLNVELNTKRSDVSEVIDYHSAPITLVYGAKIGNLEKGANKVWGGLPKDGRVENLSLQGDLTASVNYTNHVKTAMCEIGGIPETVLGGASAISNTSGVALQYINMPMIEKANVKRLCSVDGLVAVNKMILYIGYIEGLIEKPENISMREFLYNTVTLPDTLPKDELMELQKIESELRLALECRHGAMERLNKEDVAGKILEIDKEREEHPEIFNPALQSVWYQSKVNSGMMNGQTPIEQVRTELTGQNGGGQV